MGIRMALTKQSAIGEQFVVDVGSWNPVTGELDYDSIDSMLEAAQSMLKLADVRTEEMHLRMLEGYNVRKYVTQDQWTKILDVLEVICGKQSMETVVRRWESALEETAELEQGRLEHAMKTAQEEDYFDKEDELSLAYESHKISLEDSYKALKENGISFDIKGGEVIHLREEIEKLGCTCAKDHQHNCPIHADLPGEST
jgi:hypothetical protein